MTAQDKSLWKAVFFVSWTFAAVMLGVALTKTAIDARYGTIRTPCCECAPLCKCNPCKCCFCERNELTPHPEPSAN